VNRYRISIKAARPYTVEAEDEKDAFDVAFEQTEWDYDIELVAENIETSGVDTHSCS
jgi:hypothetical protein